MAALILLAEVAVDSVQRWLIECRYGHLTALRLFEIIEVAAKRFSYHVRSRSVFDLGHKVNLFKHGRGQCDQYFFWHSIHPHGAVSDYLRYPRMVADAIDVCMRKLYTRHHM